MMTLMWHTEIHCWYVQERSILGTEVGFPDAMRFKGAAPEIINSRCVKIIVAPSRVQP